MNNVYHSTDLDLEYVPYQPGQPTPEGDRRKCLRLRFDDGGLWSIGEALFASWEGLEGDDLRAIHRVKRIFDGELQTQAGVRYVQTEGRQRQSAAKRLIKRLKPLKT